MRAYELMMILKPTLDEERTTALIERVTGLLASNGAEVEKVDRWGKRRFAYEVKHYREGHYIVVDYRSEPTATRELDRVLKLTDDVLRHMIVSRDA